MSRTKDPTSPFLEIADLLKPEDWATVSTILGGSVRPPDETIYSGGKPYIYRWHVIPRRAVGCNIYLHLQVADDSERAMHDHPWSNQSVILSGGYVEEFWKMPPWTSTKGVRTIKKGDVVHRGPEEAHRLKLLTEQPYTISLFSTGPVVREWGFWEEFPIPKWITQSEYKSGRQP